MKYLQVTPVASPIESWLHSQLEARGVDKVYSRYILSLFHSNDFDQEFLDFDLPSKELKRLTRKSQHSRNVDTQKLIRSSVIECLTSVSEYKVGIESLVDELYARLNNTDIHVAVSTTSQQDSLQPLSNDSTNTTLDLAQKYYDAFPPLGGRQHSFSSTHLKHSPWNGKNKKLLTSSSSSSSSGNHLSAITTTSGIKKFKSNNMAFNLSSIDTVDGGSKSTLNTDSIEKKLNMNLTFDSLEKSLTKDMDEDKQKSVKRKLFVEIEESKDSLTSLMEKVDGTKDIWSDSETQSQLSASSVSSFIPWGTNLTTSIWSDTESDRSKWSDSGVGMSLLIATGPVSTSKTTLNHCPERSAFRAVTPGLKTMAPPSNVPSGTPVQPSPSTSSSSTTSQEEDLLTSWRTHFRPVDKAPYYKNQLSDGVQYANGTTFNISSQLDSVDYQIGEDGTLTWDSDTYMEFKANGLNTECYNLYDPFKPKFKIISQGQDKNIQTDDFEFAEAASKYLKEVPNLSASFNAKSHLSFTTATASNDASDDFYFPGEESIARDIMKSLDDDDSFYMEEEEPCIKKSGPLLVDAWTVVYPASSIWSHTSLASLADDGWPTPSHDYKDIRCEKKKQTESKSFGLYENYSVWAPSFPLDKNSNVILCSKSETPIPLGVTMGNLKISSSDRKRRHSSSQYYGNYVYPCTGMKSDVNLFQQSITL